MPKMKTRKGAAKRIIVLKSGKARYKKANKRHILTTKSKKVKRHNRRAGYVVRADIEKVYKVLPYA